VSSSAEAVRLFRAGRVAEAEAAVNRALAANARDAEALHLLGCIRAQAGAHVEALKLLDQAVALEPGNAAFAVNRGRVLAQLGVALVRAGDAEGAARAFEGALPAFPHDASLRNNLGIALQRLGRAEEALAQFRQAAALDPALQGVLVNWGNALETQGDLEGAARKYAEAIARNPASAPAWLNAASIAADRGRSAEAREAYARVLQISPASADAQYGLGLLDLRERRFLAGWRGYERRFDTDPPQSARRAPPLPPFTQADVGGEARVAVWIEMGIGDQVLFSTLLPQLRDSCAHVVAEADPRMLAAYRRSVPGIQFVPAGDLASLRDCDRQVAIGSLPSLFRPDAASFAAQPRALLKADGARVQAIRAALPPGPCVAISWRSLQRGTRASRAARKSIGLASFASLARAAGVTLVDVQYGDVEAERRQFEREHPGLLVRVPALDAFNDLEGVMAAIVACGRVLTASNVVAHLGGALGVRTTVVFLEDLAPFHYWDARDGARSLWYPSLEIATDPGWHAWPQALDALSARFDR
jgi:tetratricopeptide (TPR) repeat protein